ncbi:unnamed protein product, partial [Rotaria sordida]
MSTEQVLVMATVVLLGMTWMFNVAGNATSPWMVESPMNYTHFKNVSLNHTLLQQSKEKWQKIYDATKWTIISDEIRSIKQSKNSAIFNSDETWQLASTTNERSSYTPSGA